MAQHTARMHGVACVLLLRTKTNRPAPSSPVRSGLMIHEATILATPDQCTAPQPFAVTAMPITPPTQECVVETGSS